MRAPGEQQRLSSVQLQHREEARTSMSPGTCSQSTERKCASSCAHDTTECPVLDIAMLSSRHDLRKDSIPCTSSSAVGVPLPWIAQCDGCKPAGVGQGHLAIASPKPANVKYT